MWYTRNKFYSETAEENLQEAKIACDAETPWTYNIDINSQKQSVIQYHTSYNNNNNNNNNNGYF